MTKYKLNYLNMEKESIVFTWDDNFKDHYNIIAPIFLDYNYRCTFFVNPGESCFTHKYYEGYKKTCDAGFEIGSHGFTHHHFSKCSSHEFILQLSKSKDKIKELFLLSPITFAFPHHDYNDEMLRIAKSIYLETRNTLINSTRFSLKTNTNIEQVKVAIEESIIKKQNLIFSGHSILNKLIPEKGWGYEPTYISTLINILEMLCQYNEVQICTFEQACIKEFIKKNCVYNHDCFELSKNNKLFLEKLGYSNERIVKII